MHDGPVHMRPQQPGCTFTIYSEFGMKYQFRESAATFWPLATVQLLGSRVSSLLGKRMFVSLTFSFYFSLTFARSIMTRPLVAKGH